MGINTVRNHWGIILVLVIVCGCDILIVSSSSQVNNDDSYIFFRFAKNFQQYGELTYNAGQKTLGYTSLLWTLMLAAGAGLFRLDPIVIAKILMVLLHAGSVLVLYLIALKIIGRMTASLVAVVLYCLDMFVLDCALSGMETPLAVLLYLGVIAGVAYWNGRKPYVLGTLMLLAALTRPEFLLLMPAFFIFELIDRKVTRGQLTADWWISQIRVFVIPAIGMLVFAVYLKLTFGVYSPPTYIGKILTTYPAFMTAPYLERLNIGFKALGILAKNLFSLNLMRPFCFFTILASMVYAIPVVLELKKGRNHYLLFPYIAVSLHFLAYFLMFPANTWRYHIHIVPVVYLSLVAGYQYIASIPNEMGREHKPSHRGYILKSVFAVGLIAVIGYTYESVNRKKSIFRDGNTIDICRPVADFMNQTLPKDSLVALDKIGQMGYLMDAAIFDLGGLIDPDVWPLLQNKSDMNLLYETFKRKRVTHVLIFGDHIMWSFLPVKLGNLTMVKEFKFTTPVKNNITLYEVDYSRPLEVKQSRPQLGNLK